MSVDASYKKDVPWSKTRFHWPHFKMIGPNTLSCSWLGHYEAWNQQTFSVDASSGVEVSQPKTRLQWPQLRIKQPSIVNLVLLITLILWGLESVYLVNSWNSLIFVRTWNTDQKFSHNVVWKRDDKYFFRCRWWYRQFIMIHCNCLK